MTVHEALERVQTELPRHLAIRGFVYTVNKVVAKIRSRGQWSWMFATDVISTVDDYSTGTVAVANGGTTLTGTDTVWTSAMVGRKIRIASGPEYVIASRTSNTEIAITETFQETTETAASYVIYQNVYSLASDVQRVLKVWDLTDSEEYKGLTPADIRTRDNVLGSAGLTRFFSPWGRDSSNYPRIYVSPYPTAANNIEYTYFKVPTAVTGPGSTIDTPATLNELVVQGCLYNILRQNREWDAFRTEYGIFGEMLEQEYRNDHVDMDFTIRMRRQDEMSALATGVNIAPTVTECAQ